MKFFKRLWLSGRVLALIFPLIGLTFFLIEINLENAGAIFITMGIIALIAFIFTIYRIVVVDKDPRRQTKTPEANRLLSSLSTGLGLLWILLGKLKYSKHV